MSDRETVLFANIAFYTAFATRDVKAMEHLWAAGDVVCIHPGWPPLQGREAVLASWRSILANPNAPNISCRGAIANVHGTTAVVTCMEMIASQGEGTQVLAATNVFIKPPGTKEWRMIHHHAGPAHIDPEKIEEEESQPMN